MAFLLMLPILREIRVLSKSVFDKQQNMISSFVKSGQTPHILIITIQGKTAGEVIVVDADNIVFAQKLICHIGLLKKVTVIPANEEFMIALDALKSVKK